MKTEPNKIPSFTPVLVLLLTTDDAESGNIVGELNSPAMETLNLVPAMQAVSQSRCLNRQSAEINQQEWSGQA